jgi:hypothetical protein
MNYSAGTGRFPPVSAKQRVNAGALSAPRPSDCGFIIPAEYSKIKETFIKQKDDLTNAIRIFVKTEKEAIKK